MNRILKIFLLLTFVSVLQTNELPAQQQLRSIIVEPPARAYFRFSNFPIRYTSQLSEDKRRVIINLKGTSVVDSARNKQGGGIIQEIYVQTTVKDISIFSSLTEPKGYTAAPLPYTRAIMLDVFNWDKLSPADDYYRTALLALEDNIIESAKKDLLSAAIEKNSEAAMFLGIILLGEGKVNSAIKNLEFAEKSGVKIPDLFAALSQAYSIKLDKDRSISYGDKFKASTAMSFVPVIPVSFIIENDSTYTEPIAHLFVQDTLVPADTAKADTSGVNSKFDALFADSTAKADDSIIPGVYNEIVTMVGGVAVAIILLIILVYLKWRNKQILLRKNTGNQAPKTKRKTPPPSKPEEKSADNLEAKKLFAAKAYAKPTSRIKDSLKTDAASFGKPPEKAPDKKTEESNKKDIENLLETIRNVSAEKQEAAKEIENAIEETKHKPISAKLEIAMHLAEEQRKIKQKNIDSLGKSIEIDHSKLTDTAKKLGIEKGSLETKKAIDDIEKDDQALQKLQAKFNRK